LAKGIEKLGLKRPLFYGKMDGGGRGVKVEVILN